MKELYIKDDGVNHPTLSYKDRVVSVAATRAVELGFTTFGCASTGNLGNSVAAHAARLGLECYVFIPDNLETGKVVGSGVYQPHLMAIRGNYDDVNRLCTQVADKYHWGFANINLRSYYAEGAKTFGFEIVEQLGWKFPKHVVSPVAGGTLLPRIARGFREFKTLGLGEGDLPKMYAAQAAGCAPVVRALHDGLDHPDPVKPDTIAKSIAIGNPADGFQVLETLRATGGWGEMVDRRGTALGDRTARGDGRHLHRAGRRHHPRGGEKTDRAGTHPARRIYRRLHHGQRLQDVGDPHGSHAARGASRTRAEGLRRVHRRPQGEPAPSAGTRTAATARRPPTECGA